MTRAGRCFAKGINMVKWEKCKPTRLKNERRIGKCGKIGKIERIGEKNMKYQDVLEQAKQKMAPKCKVCPECNGIACRGIAPGPGGKGSASTFRRNVTYLADHVKVHMDVMGEETIKDTTIELFDKQFVAPIFCAPIGMVSMNYGVEETDYEYNKAVVEGAKNAGIAAFGGGGLREENFLSPLQAIKDSDGWGIPTLKPWEMDVVRERIVIMQDYHPFAFAMDIDSSGLAHAGKSLLGMVQKSKADIAEIASLCKLPFLVKGIMTVESAIQAADAGVYGIIVSNHGGRVLDHGLSSAEVLREIKEAVGDRVKIFVDGGIRTGMDVFKMLALGADAVLIGRPYAIAVLGGGAEGVEIYTNKLIAELKDTMKMTSCQSLQDITFDKIRIC